MHFSTSCRRSKNSLKSGNFQQTCLANWCESLCGGTCTAGQNIARHIVRAKVADHLVELVRNYRSVSLEVLAVLSDFTLFELTDIAVLCLKWHHAIESLYRDRPTYHLRSDPAQLQAGSIAFQDRTLVRVGLRTYVRILYRNVQYHIN